MPFTLDGNWIPAEKPSESTPSKPVKVRKVKRKNITMTVIYNLNPDKYDLKEIAKKIKKKLGIGGAVKENNIELQGDKVSEICELLITFGIKAS